MRDELPAARVMLGTMPGNMGVVAMESQWLVNTIRMIVSVTAANTSAKLVFYSD